MHSCPRFVPVFKVLLELATSFHDIIFADDIVPVKHSAGFVAADGHRDFFWHLAAHERAHARAAQVMQQESAVNQFWFRLRVRPIAAHFHLRIADRFHFPEAEFYAAGLPDLPEISHPAGDTAPIHAEADIGKAARALAALFEQ